MKTHKKYFLGTLILILFFSITTSCGDDWLTVVPVNAVTPENYYKDEAQILKAVNAAYSALGNRGMFGWWQGLIRNVRGDNCETVEANVIAHSNFTVNDTDIRLFNRTNGDGLWNSIYVGALRCNLIIRNAPNATFSNEASRNKLIGEARFLRALYYFYLVDYWNRGPLLLDTNFNVTDVPASEAAEIYAAIENDLTTIINNAMLPFSYDGSAGNEIGRATIGSARALLGKVYLFQNKFTQAIEQFEQIVTSNQYALIDVSDIWSVHADNGSEYIFEVQFNNDKAGPNAFFDDGVNAAETTLRNQTIAPNQYSGWENAWPSADLVNSFEPGDLRREAFIVLPGELFPTKTDPFEGLSRNRGGFAIKKGMGSGFSTATPNGTGEENYPVIRYADVLLMYAEALIRSNSNSLAATDLIDRVRARGFGYASIAELRNANLGIESYALAKGITLFEALKQERRRELCFEGHRYSDLVRWGDLSTNTILVDRGWRPEVTYYPISREDIDLSSLLN